MPKINVYLPDDLAAAVRDAQLPVSGICQAALERAVRDVESARNLETAPAADRNAPGVFSRFTPRAQEAMQRADESARASGHPSVATAHVLLGVLDQGQNLATLVLTSLEIEPDDVRAELVASMGPTRPRVDDPLPFTPHTQQVLEATTKEALALGHNYVGCEHLLLGLLGIEDGLASQVLRRMGLELRTTRRAVVSALSGFAHARPDPIPRPGTADDALREVLRRLDAIEASVAALRTT